MTPIHADEDIVTTQAVDTLQDGTCPEHGCKIIALRCFVRRAGDHFVAECIDLDLAAEAATPTEAVESLKDAMNGYFSVVCDSPHPDFTGLVPRPSPLTNRLRYHVECIKYAILRGLSLRERPTPDLHPGSERFYECRVPSLSSGHCAA